ncbi:MAG: NUDIX hydrolase [Desulfarculaceae bacterium]|jgi:8-oxo-dGTP pyrophosphatase MutT (NUDIX family)
MTALKDWPLVSSEAAGDHGLFKVTQDRAVSPRTGAERDFLVIHMPDWLQVVALTEEGRLLLVRQYRHGSRRLGLEVPGGLLDPQDSDPARAAARELREETGYGAVELKRLGSLYPQPALMANQVHFFSAVGVKRLGAMDQDEGEDLEVVLVSVSEVGQLIASARIHNAMTITALSLAARAGLIRE